MAQRDELFRKFGPILLETITDVLLDNINELREQHDMPRIEKDDCMTQLNNHSDTLNPYDWMTEDEQ